jgi:cytosine/adenosine deaminase-related metal-dependent hydrolase
MSADLVAFRLDSVGFAGAQLDPLAALLFCASVQADFTVINGRVVVQDGQLLTQDLPVLVEKHNALSRRLING